ncbi:MAG: ATP-dependent Clp protease adapter ClpS [Desulfatitalea sp.]|nr:ATP-dependent Clp protease adapter ClpS [Desulfatitalea sp.]NNJ99257.1 ATP-dependent Clp protease adapter ClpS [Desulfatitalea sp.]
MSNYLPETIGDIDTRTRQNVNEPSMYKVLLHNDDYTTMEFVVHVLIKVFHKSVEAATRIMLNVHKRGVGLCGVYSYEIAETKVQAVMLLARQNGHPLKCTMERE